MMARLIDTFCPQCDVEVRATLRNQEAALSVRGEDVVFTETVAICLLCGGVIGDARIERENLERAYDIYRKHHGIMAPGEIRILREFYRLSLREFSKFLGFDEQTVYLYEHGDIPDQAHNTSLEYATNAKGAQLLLSWNRQRLSACSTSRIEQAIEAVSGQAG